MGCKYQKNMAKSFAVSQGLLIFAASNLRSGTDAAGFEASVFCATTYLGNNHTTPSPEPGNRPGVSASKNLTARSVVLLCQNLEANDNLNNSRIRSGSAAHAGMASPGEQEFFIFMRRARHPFGSGEGSRCSGSASYGYRFGRCHRLIIIN